MAYRKYRASRRRRAFYAFPTYYAPISKAIALQQKASAEAIRFVRQAFFALEPARLEWYFTQYANENGLNAASYARKTYCKWRSGAVAMSGETAMRLLKIVPGILPRQDQLKLLEIYIPYLQQSLAEIFRESLTSEVIPVLELELFYQKAEAIAQKMTLPVGWFVKGVFTEDEIAHFEEVIRFLLIQRLERSFSSVTSDLIHLHNACADKPLAITLQYQISVFGALVELESAQGIQNLNYRPSFHPIKTGISEDIREMLLRNAATTLSNDESNEQRSSGIQSIALGELSTTLNSIELSGNTSAIAEATLRVETKGGVAVLGITKLSVPLLKQKLRAAKLKQNALILVALCIAGLIIQFGRQKKTALSFLGLIIGCPVGFSLWHGWREEVENLENQIEQYELAKRKVFAKQRAVTWRKELPNE